MVFNKRIDKMHSVDPMKIAVIEYLTGEDLSPRQANSWFVSLVVGVVIAAAMFIAFLS